MLGLTVCSEQRLGCQIDDVRETAGSCKYQLIKLNINEEHAPDVENFPVPALLARTAHFRRIQQRIKMFEH